MVEMSLYEQASRTESKLRRLDKGKIYSLAPYGRLMRTRSFCHAFRTMTEID